MSRLDELISDEREAMVPSASTRAENLAALRRGLAAGRPPLVDAPPPAAAVGAAGSGWLEATIVSVLIVGALVWWLAPDGDGANGRTPVGSAVQPVAPVPATEPAAEHPAAPTPRSTPARSTVVDAAPPEEPSAAEASPPKAPVETSRARPSGRRAAEPAAVDDFAAELALLKRAKAAHVGGDRKHALALLRDQGRKFRPGAFAEERRALEAILLCELGRRERGQQAAADFYRDFAASPQTERVRHACD